MSGQFESKTWPGRTSDDLSEMVWNDGEWSAEHCQRTIGNLAALLLESGMLKPDDLLKALGLSQYWAWGEDATPSPHMGDE